MLVGVISTAFALSSILVAAPASALQKTLLKQDGLINSSSQVDLSTISVEDRKNKILTKYENATSLTDSQLVELLKAVGFKGKGLRMAWAIAKTESNGRPFAFNGNTKTGDSSYGIFQINMIGTLGPDRREKLDLNLNAELFSPVTNAEAVFYMTKGGTDWTSWSSYKTGAVYKWLNKFPE